MNREDLQAWLTRRVAECTRIQISSIDPERPVSAYGLDSAAAVGISGELAELLAIHVEPSLFLEYPSISEAAVYLSGAKTTAIIPWDSTQSKRDSAGMGIGIVGIGCRVPKAADVSAFWALLLDGTDAVSEIPIERWDWKKYYSSDQSASGKTISRWGGFIDQIDRFDAGFFRISPEEARRMDPQQRLLLEVSWEALEDAGIVPSSIKGRQIGVFVGISQSEYWQRQMLDEASIRLATATGCSLAVSANRLSYFYDFRGPSIAVDTACSASLVSVHLAVESLRRGECEMALTSGVNVVLEPQGGIALNGAGVLSPRGRCRSFDAGADGYVRGEGCGVLVLKPLAKAKADRSRIYAVIRGSAVNQDGRSNGLTAPNPRAQEAVLKSACADAGIKPEDVQYVEAHGSSTPLGDLVEAKALGAVLGGARGPQRPLLVGSVKSNIGHLESAAGIAGMIKAALSLHRKTIPGNLHFEKPNQNLQLERLNIQVVNRTTAWPDWGDTNICGISSFGFGGTNAHVILSGYDDPGAQQHGTGNSAWLIPVSARSRKSLIQQLSKLTDHFDAAEAPLDIEAIAFNLSTRREHHEFRRSFVCESVNSLVGKMRSVKAQLETHEPTRAKVAGKPPRIALVFSGQGGQWAGMGHDLMAEHPLFGSVVKRCDEAVEDLVDWSIARILSDASAGSEINSTAVAQPCLVAMQIAQFHLLQSLGVEPDVVVGHSMGEISAAFAAGVLDLDAAIRLAVLRSRRISAAVGLGTMLSVEASPDEAERLIRGEGKAVSIGAVNGPRSIVLSGERETLKRLGERLKAENRFVQWLPIDLPSHSAQMEGPAARLIDDLSWLSPGEATIPMVSTTTGRPVEGHQLDANYWADNLRRTVRFSDAISFIAAEREVDAFVEVGAQPILRTPIRQTLSSVDRSSLPVLGGLEAGKPTRQQMLQLLGKLYELGVDVNFRPLFRRTFRHLSLPTYAWDHSRHWIERAATVATRSQEAGSVHPLLGRRMQLAGFEGTNVWESSLSTDGLPYLADRAAGLSVILPAAAFIEIFAAAARHMVGTGGIVLRDLRFLRALPVSCTGRRVQTVAQARDGGFVIRIFSGLEDAPPGRWELHAQALLEAEAPARTGNRCLDDIKTRCTRHYDQAEAYQLLEARNLRYGPLFRGLQQIWSGADEAVSMIALPKSIPDADLYEVDPRLLDSALQTVIGIQNLNTYLTGNDSTFVPTRIFGVSVRSRTGSAAHAHVSIDKIGDLGFRGSVEASRVPTISITVADSAGVPSIVLHAVEFEALNQIGVDSSPPAAYETRWRPFRGRRISSGGRGMWVVIANKGSTAEELVKELTGLGNESMLVDAGSSDAHQAINLGDAGGYQRLIEKIVAHSAGKTLGIVDMRSLDRGAEGDSHSLRVIDPSSEALYLIQAVCAQNSLPELKLVLVTSGACAVNRAQELTSFSAAALWGLARTARFEVPGLYCKCVDLDPLNPKIGARCLAHELTYADPELEVAWRDGQRYLLQIVRQSVRTDAPERTTLPLDRDGTYVVAGGEWPNGGRGVSERRLGGEELSPRPDIGEAFVAPSTETQLNMAKIWSEYLGIDGVGINDSLFDLGGDSVIANQIVIRINRKLGVALNMADVLPNFTIAALAREIDHFRENGDADADR